MAGIKTTTTGVIIDLYGRVISGPIKLVGETVYSALGVGGGPIFPPEGGNGDKPPGFWGPPGPWPTPPIYIPPMVPPGMKPPEAPQPGDPTTAVPGNWPVQPITPPDYLIVQYPGIGPVVVAPPAEPTSEPKPA